MRTITIVLIVSFLAGTSASPVNLAVQTRSGSTCLAVLLTLFLLLSLLVICKQIFMKNRRTQPFAPGCSFTIDSSLRSSASMLPSNASIHNSDDGKTGVLVGLFGSPSWETRTKTMEYRDKLGWREPRDAFYAYRLHTGSRHANNYQARNSSSTEKSTMFDIVQSQFFSVARSTVGDMRALYEKRNATGLGQRRSRSLRAPVRPSKAYIGFPDTRTPRRFSLPAIGRRDSRIGSVYQKSASSLTIPKSRRSVSTSSSLANSSLRLVETNDRPDLPLPLSPNHPQAPTFQTLQSFTPLKANLSSKHDISTLPSLPPSPPFPSQPRSPGVVKKDLPKTSSALLWISHPYALTPTNSQATSLESITGTPSRRNRASHSKVFQATSNYIRPPQPVLISKADCQSPIAREPLAQVTSSINYSPLVFPSSSAVSIYSGLSPYPPLTSLNPPKVKHKPNTPSPRVRRSPAIGPSPLRSMILPDPSDTNIVTQPTSEGKVASTFGEKNYYTRLGLGFPPASYRGSMDKIDKFHETTTATDLERNNRRHTGAQVSQQVEVEDSNLLLGILRELVEETSEWDASLFMDQNFKAMIQGSEFSSLPRERLIDSKSAPNGLSSDHSEEVDLGNLGIDIFRSDGETFIPPTGNPSSPGNDNVELVSFWDERGWANPENKWYVYTPLSSMRCQ